MGFDDYKVVLYRNQPDGWVADIPAIPGCYALMPTREDALVELAGVFRLISEEYGDRNEPLPADTTGIVHAWRPVDEFRRAATKLGFLKARRQPRTMEASRRARHNDPDSWWTANRPSTLLPKLEPTWN